jgi:hypothetical protein
VEGQEEVWIIGDGLKVAAAFEVHDPPGVVKATQQRGLAALTRADDGHAGEEGEVLFEEGLARAYHTVHY